MCVADKSDDKLFEKIKEKYHATLTEYPMVRVANADKTEHLEGRGEIIIQGQQIGISEIKMERKYMLSINRTGQQRLSRSTGTITKRHRLYISDSLVNIVIMLIMRQHTIRK